MREVVFARAVLESPVERFGVGDSAFAGARGLITSNFTVSVDGEVVDNHFARLYLPTESS